jgi:streptogramin lyase
MSLLIVGSSTSTYPAISTRSFVTYSFSNLTQTSGYKIIQYPLPNGSSEPWWIATDRSGNVWFVEQGSNQLGKLNPSTRVMTEYSIPTQNSTVISVAADYSGNVWIAELSANKLGELKNGTSTIIDYPIPGAPYQLGGTTQTESCGPTGVVPDSGGNIWVLCIFSNQIDEFFPGNSSFLSFNLPVYYSAPAGLVFDHSGGFWFTAADADMLGHGVISELQNQTSKGITEFAPINQTYSFTLSHPLGPLGPYENLTSSLPTPSGIALAPDGVTLWISEHVDSSFDSYNIQSKSLTRYWTSSTNNAFGYAYSFPNGIAIDGQGRVWIAEHYGNKIAEFDPNTDQLAEFNAPCCGGNGIGGTYSLALGINGTVWFVEIYGNAIGEIEPVESNQTFSMTLGTPNLNFGPSDSGNIPVSFSLTGIGSQRMNVTLGISGISATGNLTKASAQFNPGRFVDYSQGNASSVLTLETHGLGIGTYYLTVSASVSPQGVIYSRILKLTVSGSSSLSILTYGLIAAVMASVVVVGMLALRTRRRGFMSARRRQARARFLA